MIANNIKLLWRNVLHNKITYFIGFLSLLTGITCALITFILAVYELRYDDFHQYKDRIYRVSTAVTIEGNSNRLAVSPRQLGHAIVSDLSDVTDFTRIRQYESGIFDFQGKKLMEKKVLLAEPNFFRFFSFPLVKGDTTALENPGSVVVTEDFARRVFGEADPIGKTLNFLDKFPLIVTGVVRNIPGNSHLQFNVLIAYNTFNLQDAWDEIDVYTYIMRNEKTDESTLSRKLDVFSKTHIEEAVKEYNATMALRLIPLPDIHLTTDLEDELSPAGSMGYIYMLFSIAFFFLLIGCCSYININIANSIRRVKEVGMKRVLGATPRDIAGQFVTEFMTITLVVLLLAIGLVLILLPVVSAFVDKRIGAGILYDARILVMYLLVILLAGVVSVLYLLFGLLKYSPQQMLQKRLVAGRVKFSAMQLVVLFQFGVSIIMLLMIFVIRGQVHYISTIDLGLNNKNILSVEVPVGEAGKASVFKQSLLKQPGIMAVSSDDFAPAEKDIKNIFRVNMQGKAKDKVITSYYVDESYIPTMGCTLTAGRNFNPDFPSDYNGAVLVNETLVKQMGWRDPLQERLKGPLEAGGTSDRDAAIVGVVKDFYINSLHNPIEPLVLMLSPKNGRCKYMHIKLVGNNAGGTIKKVEDIYKTHFRSAPFRYEFLEDKYDQLYKNDRKLVAILMQGTAAVLLITCLGIFGLSAMFSSRMEKEMGIRKALGCSSPEIFYLYVKRFLRLCLIANIIALPLAAYLISLWLREYTYRIGFSWIYFAGTILLSVFIVIGTTSYHAGRIARQKVVKFLRAE
ncbi:ABC transporter permease [Chitinophaga pendula]|uniref:ABC transporter permease n=1 Tax=Chitinophaga TaxID=79328 RepID=UPI000BAECE1A|nr:MULTISPECIES: FtsX-like permease family protein [Chitinophaga]ASZ09485.1 hypothetical protein CK934_00070 [Chitinophaga sp. MD30]UCJ07585.1 ABC transporter permease [Chitinophaga pendula]